MDLVVIRILFILVLTAACFFLRPFGLQPWAAAVLGAVAAAAVIVFELRVRALSIKRLLGAVLGSVLGIAGAALFGMVLSGSLPPGGTRALLQLFVLMLMSYVGLMVGASKGDLLNFTGGLAELFAGERAAGGKRNLKILDTSAIIDGRIADVVETGFLEGTLAGARVCVARAADRSRFLGQLPAAARPARTGYSAKDAGPSVARRADHRG